MSEPQDFVDWKGKRLSTVPEIIDTGLKIKDPERQKEFVDLVETSCGPHALSNVGYFAGYYDTEKAKQILKVFRTHHPIFGKEWPDKPVDAFAMGVAMGEKARDRRNK